MFNALDLMDNKEFLEPLKFGVGDGNLQYYLYNWKCPEINSNKVIIWYSLNIFWQYLYYQISLIDWIDPSIIIFKKTKTKDKLNRRNWYHLWIIYPVTNN